MARSASPAVLPDLSPERLLERVAEAVEVSLTPAALKKFPAWTQRVMRILRQQFVPREFASILAGGPSAFAEGIAVAWVANARDLAAASGSTSGRFARQLAQRLALDPSSQAVAVQVESGDFALSADFQQQVIHRLLNAGFSERRAFTEGLALGHRLPELLDVQAKRRRTDATGIYLLLWFYWPEISRLNSVAEVATILEPFFAENKNLAGANWQERIRKLANRLGLSFRARQQRRRRLRSKPA